jgi:hypothetical protein
MKDLIEALSIMYKYVGDVDNPTHCEHDVLHVACSPSDVSQEDVDRLEELGFFPDEFDGFSSFRFGSC